jgi:hypothetical protein
MSAAFLVCVIRRRAAMAVFMRAENNIPGRIMSKVEACQRRMKRNRKHKMVVPLSNYDRSGGSKEDDDNDDWSKVEESKASMKPGAARKRRTKAKKQKRMLFSALMKTAIAARRRITQTRKAALMLDLFPDESSFSFQRVLAVERANAEFKKRVNLQKKTKAVTRMQVIYRKRQSSRLLEKMKLKVSCIGCYNVLLYRIAKWTLAVLSWKRVT